MPPLPKPARFPMVAAALSILAALLLVADLTVVKSDFVRLLASNSLDAFVVALAAATCFYTAFRSSGFPRQVWLLLSVAFALETLSQALSAYYQSFAPGSFVTPIPSDILFFVWAAPVLMILRPHSEEESSGVDTLRLLDYLQVAIVALAAYLYFFYFSERWQGDALAVSRGLLFVFIGRDLVISLCFLWRASGSHTPWFRRFAFTLAISFFLSLLSDVEYLLTLNTSLSMANWGDILWMFPSIVVLLFAAQWKSPEVDGVSSKSAVSRGYFFASQFFPVALPLLVIFFAREISRERPHLAWLTLTASVLCSSVRLVLAARRQSRTAATLLNAEKALLRSEQVLSSAFRASPDGFAINIFPNGPYIDVNEGFTRLTGYSREEAIGKTPLEMNLWFEPNRRSEILSALSSSKEVNNFEFQFRTKSGAVRIGQMSGSLLDIDGQTCALIAVRDITERKAAEELLRTNEERFRSLIEHMHVGIASCDPQGRIQFANRAALDMFGVSIDSVRGKSFIDLRLIPLREDGTPLSDDERPVTVALRTRQPILNSVVGFRHPLFSRTIWSLLDVIPELLPSGEVRSVLLSVTDLTDQRRVLEALRESEERFRTLVRDLHVGVVLQDPNGVFQFANRAAFDIFGFSYNETFGQRFEELGLIPQDEQGRPLTVEDLPFSQVIRSHTAARDVVVGWQRMNQPGMIWTFGNAVPQCGPDGSLVRVITSFSDITQMKMAERSIHKLSTELLRLQDDERRRIGRELHDGMAQTVLGINLNLAQVRHSSDLLSTQARAALDRARDLLQQMSREIRTLSYLLHPPLLDDLGLVSALKEYVQGFSERSGIETTLELRSHFPRLPQVAETALFRITQESLSNIQRHSGSARAVVRLEDKDGDLTLEIIDFGRGVFTDGFTDATPSRLGVGIPGMRERMAQLGGSLEILSTSSGTTVRARISLSSPVLKEGLHDTASYLDRG